jgi:hypothetical protein
MHTIYKYPLVIKGYQYIDVPLPAIPISVCEQNGDVVIYCIVDPEKETKKVEINIAGTGLPMKFYDDNWHFLGTVKTLDGQYMWHVFQKL